MPTKPNKKVNRKRKAESTPRAKKRRKQKKAMPVFVVDEHNDAMLPFLDAVKSKKLPKRAVKMLHYDSHPDLGNITKDAPKVMANVAKGKVDKKKLHNLTDIATWITPLVLAGYIDEVIWVCGSWCHQIDEGSYDLVCGVGKDGKLKTCDANGDNESNSAVTDYWDCDGTAGELEELESRKEWTLHVVKHKRNGKLGDEDFNFMSEVLANHPWVLDIDEDFFSCNNPHRDDFTACFGDKQWQLVKKIYDIGSPWDTDLETILNEKLFLKKESAFMKLKPVKSVVKQMKEENLNGVELMKKFRTFLDNTYEKEYLPGVNVEGLFSLEDFHTAGLYSGLPHNLTHAKVIVEMANGVEEILNEMKKNNPVHVTLATSRADRYLPDCQAAIIHSMLDGMMEALYEDVTVTRMDKPEFSIVFASDDEDDES